MRYYNKRKKAKANPRRGHMRRGFVAGVSAPALAEDLYSHHARAVSSASEAARFLCDTYNISPRMARLAVKFGPSYEV